jgi:hypothetical protein
MLTRAIGAEGGGGAMPNKNDGFREQTQQQIDNLVREAQIEAQISELTLDRIKTAIKTTTWQIGEGVGALYDLLTNNGTIKKSSIAGGAAGTAFLILLSLLVLI